MIDYRENAVEAYRNMGLFEHTVAWNQKQSKNPHVKVLDMGFGLAKVFAPKNVGIDVCYYCVYADMKENCPQKRKNKS